MKEGENFFYFFLWIETFSEGNHKTASLEWEFLVRRGETGVSATKGN